MLNEDTATYDIIMKPTWPQVKRLSSPALEYAGRRRARGGEVLAAASSDAAM
jgi:hypothetical protein